MRENDEFLSVLAHEMRMPLAPIGSALEVLRLGARDPLVTEYVRGVISRQLRQLERLVDDLLDVSRLAHGHVSLHISHVDMCAVIKAAIETAQPLIDARRHQLTVQLPEAGVMVEADAGRLTQVFVNLLNNAAKYTAPGGRIWVSVEQDALWGIVKVRDTGIGIDPKMLPHVFEMFVRAHPDAAPAERGAETNVDDPAQRLDASAAGLGVGLALARQLVELHGGGISVRSDGLERGSEFTVCLPLRIPVAPPVAMSST